MRAVGFKIYGSGWSANSDRPNRLAVPGRPIGDQRQGFDRLLSLLLGRTARAVTAASDGGARRRRDLAMEIARLWVKRDEAYMASLKERSDWSGDHRRRS